MVVRCYLHSYICISEVGDQIVEIRESQWLYRFGSGHFVIEAHAIP